MTTATAEREVAKQRTGVGDKARRPDASVRIDRDVVKLAKLAADYEDKTLTDYLSDLLRPLVERAVDEGHARLRRPPKRPKGE